MLLSNWIEIEARQCSNHVKERLPEEPTPLLAAQLHTRSFSSLTGLLCRFNDIQP